MKLTTKELLQIATILLRYVEQRGYKNISFSKEDSYYQKVWHKDRNLESDPKITIGILDDDIDALKKLLVGETPFEYDLERLGAVLIALGAVLAKE